MKRLVLAGVLALAGCGGTTGTAKPPPQNTAAVQRGDLSAAVSQDGTLAYRAPRTVINHAHGTFTWLPAAGDEVRCGGTLYRVDDEPVLLLCGALPAYRSLRTGDAGRDVRQLNRVLRVSGGTFTAKTEAALEALQRKRGAHVDGKLALGDAVFLPRAVRIAKVAGRLGGAARPGGGVLTATSRTLHVRIALDPSDQRQVRRGDRARITLPNARTVSGQVDGAGSIRLDEPRKARGLDRVPVDVEITTKGVEDVLSVPVTALVGKAGGGFAVEAVRGERRELVPVTLGLFDTGGGRVQVEGDLRAGDRVAVPSL